MLLLSFRYPVADGPCVKLFGTGGQVLPTSKILFLWLLVDVYQWRKQKGCHHGAIMGEAEPRHRSTAAESATRPSTARPSGASECQREQLGGHREDREMRSGDPLLPIQFAWALEDFWKIWKLDDLMKTQHSAPELHWSFSRTPGVSCWVELEISKPCQATALEI